MNWSDKSFLLSKFKYQEKSLIANFFTENHGKQSGIIYGATSKKIKNYLQNGNELFIEYNSKNENALGYFKVEIIQPFTAKFFSNKLKLNCIVSMLDLIRLLTVDNQKNREIFLLMRDFYLIIDKDDWFVDYVYWELELLRIIGFDLNLKNYSKSEISNGKNFYYVLKNNSKLSVPNFLINNLEKNVNSLDIYNSLSLISEYMKTNIFSPNNLTIPLSRENFINFFK